MKVCSTQLGVAALFVLGLTPQLAGACVAVYLDHNVDANSESVQAWAWVEDCDDMGGNNPPYFEHQYHASVHIESPAQNSAGDSDNVGPIAYAGGSADAYATISYDGDFGAYDIEWEVRIACSLIGYFFQELEGDTVQAPECTMESTDSAATGVTLMWPLKEPWERGVMLFCDGPDVHTFGYYGDSFGLFYGGFGYTNDPCALTWNLAVPSNLAAIAHSHPCYLQRAT